MNHKFNVTLLKSILILLLLSYHSQAGQIHLNTFKLYSANQNYPTEYFFNFFIPSPIFNQASLEIIFSFSIEDPSPCFAILKPPDGLSAFHKCEKIDFRLIIETEKLIPGNYEILLENIHNPPVDNVLRINVRTYENRSIPIDGMEIFGEVTHLPLQSGNA